MSVDPNLQSSDEIASRAPESAAGDGVSISAQPVRKSVFREYAEAIVVAMVLAFAIRVFVVQAFKIPSGSMIPTLLIGDHILVSKLAYGIQWPSDCKFQVAFPPVNCYASHALIEFGKPQRGDIIVFRFPEDEEKDFIKRIVGVPGDEHEALVSEDGAVEVDKQAFSLEPFIFADDRLLTWADSKQTTQRWQTVLRPCRP